MIDIDATQHNIVCSSDNLLVLTQSSRPAVRCANQRRTSKGRLITRGRSALLGTPLLLYVPRIGYWS